jgi:hypothetical protein
MIGLFPAVLAADGEWRFIIGIWSKNRPSRLIFGTEPDEDGMVEPKVRVILAEHGCPPSEIDWMINVAIGLTN